MQALRFVLASLICGTATCAEVPQTAIAPEALKAHVRFLASDLLEGRSTPSKGQDIAAEYIAAQFARTGLQTASGDSWFQEVRLIRREQDPAGAVLTVTHAGRQLRFSGSEVRPEFLAPLELADAPVIRISVFEPASWEKLKARGHRRQSPDARKRRAAGPAP
ncbi:MAG TPA: hypothetical protein VFL57_15570 [Bryobacteraceae bacterium]|nr:hypothetical protein [Bryobacteraceae bacterium]